MGHLLGLSLGGPYVGLIIAVVLIGVAVGIRVYFMKRPGTMRAKCPKCSAVFDASRGFSALHVGPFKQLKCPACGKVSFMNAYSRDPLTWPLEENKPQQQQFSLSDQEQEKRRIEESKYEKV
jgi:uncharacterized C2H2 Zn-finger protein